MDLKDIIFTKALFGGSSGGGGGTPSGGDEWKPIGDGHTHIWVTIGEYYPAFKIGMTVTGGNVTVDWGDGSEPDIVTGNTPAHEYAQAGNYIITLRSDATVSIANSFIDYDKAGSNSIIKNAVKYIEIGHDISKIQAAPFCYLRNLECVTLTENWNGSFSLYGGLYRECYSLKQLIFPTGTNWTFPEYSLYQCYSLSSVHFPEGAKKLGNNVFASSNVTEVVIPNTVTEISSNVFYECKMLKKVRLGDSIQIIPYNAFYRCSLLQNITLPDSVTTLGENAFYEAGLTTLTMPGSVTTISKGCFTQCAQLLFVSISPNVTAIPEQTFYGCRAAKIYDFSRYTMVPALAATNAFYAIPADCKIHVPAALVDEWKAATNWSTYADKIVGV